MPSVQNIDKADLILKYKKLLDEGIITQEEFDKMKKELL
ncbi:MAG: SHOCT domain-containing protein [Clostridia bacterium]|nr:SHOCT domain-containing protein [Clostridia bacterium]